jgi:hypothetical protein
MANHEVRSTIIPTFLSAKIKKTAITFSEHVAFTLTINYFKLSARILVIVVER